MINNKISLFPDTTYHIYNRANGSEKLFVVPGNYDYFLQLYKQYIFPVAHTFCYCLMPNHFHFLVRIKSEKEILDAWESDLTGFKNLSGLKGVNSIPVENHLSRTFSNFFNAYSKAFNKQEGRKGSLFMRPFKRKKIDSIEYLLKLVHYIHFNPVEAGFCSAPEQWQHSSFKSILSSSATLLRREEVLSWFEDRNNFKYIHKYPPELTGIGFSELV